MIFFAVMAAGAAGAASRYLIDYWIVARRLSEVPLGTFAVNVTGSFALGLVAGLALHHGLSPGAATVIGVGFLGAYTTFSTWVYEAVRLIERGSWKAALTAVIGGLAAGTGAAAGGLLIASLTLP